MFAITRQQGNAQAKEVLIEQDFDDEQQAKIEMNERAQAYADKTFGVPEFFDNMPIAIIYWPTNGQRWDYAIYEAKELAE